MRLINKIIVLLFFFNALQVSGENNIKDNFIGFNLIYNQSYLNRTSEKTTGFGVDTYYRSFFSKNFAYKINVEFLYNKFSSNVSEPFNDILNNRVVTVNYIKDESFYNYSFGFLLNYTLYLNEQLFHSKDKFLKRLYLGISSGLIYSFLYKKNSYTYESVPSSYISTEEQSGFLPPVLSLPIIIETDYFLTDKWWLVLSFSYTYLIYSDTDEIFGENNFLNFSVGTMYKIDFKL